MKWILTLLAAFAVPLAHAEPWLCTQPDGTRQWSYEPESATNKNCVHRPITSGNVWSGRPRAERPEKAVAFPRVDGKTQKQRDAARRELLERELAEERRALAEAMKALAEQKELRPREKDTARMQAVLKPYEDRVRLHLTNISNLEKELGREG
jgi:hypothetical protein